MARSYRLVPMAMVLLGLLQIHHASCQTDCKSRINHHRTKYGITPLIEERTDLHTCANRQSEYDKQMGAHKSYQRCGPLGSQGSGGGSTCAGVIDMFVNERWRCTEMAVFGAPYKTTNEGSFRSCRADCMEDPDCLSFDTKSDATDGDKCRYYDEASLAAANKVDGTNTFWLGAPDLTASAPRKVDGWEGFSLLEIDGAKTIPRAGKITSFKWYGSNTNAVTFYLYRHVSENTYEVIGKAEATSTVVGQENTLNVNPAINVQKGDMIGFTWIGKAAFGFDENNKGEVRYRNKENSGGPINIGDEWLFDGGSLNRNYHYAASYVPNDSFTPSPPRNYCAAAKCQGHCGPVMHGGTTTFSWGEWGNFYTLNWRPNPTLPVGGDECPSGLNVVKCWDDEERGVLWAYGVRGEDCHSTCSLAGALPSDLMCNEDVPISSMEEVSEIMAKFENPYNSRDDDEFTCTKGSCWNGESNKQILVHEYNSNCYVPTNTERYVCDSRVGNGNCFGQRFNQVCPCVRGCSWAAGPSCAPSPHPSAAPISITEKPSSTPISHPTVLPSTPPTTPPSSYPTQVPSESSAEPCLENSNALFLLKMKDETTPITKGCKFLKKLKSKKRKRICREKDSFGDFSPAKDVCQVSCETCKSDCTEVTADKFHKGFRKDGVTPMRVSCGSLAKGTRKQIRWTCKNKTDSHDGFGPPKEVCPITCKSCAE